ncbi:hypothetical protein RchiOBHm_Chr7g0202291 [Rosa chinensis]|uniref:Uncharacterized protein n=1 Tax=Rosa chinensis TaxID=74649 RepID=A0A2P6P856_ROSCH|nr:hypothetical protein RchiOBHm_Chr7g0202291 [Rosa chinensis]
MLIALSFWSLATYLFLLTPWSAYIFSYSLYPDAQSLYSSLILGTFNYASIS